MSNKQVENLAKQEDTQNTVMYAVMLLMGYIVFTNFSNNKQGDKEKLNIDKKEGLMKAVNNRHIGGLILKHPKIRIFGMVVLVILFHQEILVLFAAIK